MQQEKCRRVGDRQGGRANNRRVGGGIGRRVEDSGEQMRYSRSASVLPIRLKLRSRQQQAPQTAWARPEPSALVGTTERVETIPLGAAGPPGLGQQEEQLTS